MTRGRTAGSKRATLHDVARAAGVSTTTVSNLINGKLDLMAPSTRTLIEKAISEVGYRPSASGRNLRSALRRIIGLIILDDNPSFLADSFNTNLVAGFSNLLSEHDYGVLVVGIDERRLTNSFLIRNDETDAMVLIPSGSRGWRHRINETLLKLHQPLLIFQDKAGENADSSRELLTVRQDDHQGGVLLARRLIERGVRSILFLRPGRVWPAVEERIAGIKAAIAESENRISLQIVECGRESMSDTLAAIDRYVRSASLPDAIMAANDRMGIAALRWAKLNDVAVPERLRVTGFNAFEFREYSTPTLTSVRSDAYAMGEAGAQALLARLRDGRFAQRDIVFPVALVEGESDA